MTVQRPKRTFLLTRSMSRKDAASALSNNLASKLLDTLYVLPSNGLTSGEIDVIKIPRLRELKSPWTPTACASQNVSGNIFKCTAVCHTLTQFRVQNMVSWYRKCFESTPPSVSISCLIHENRTSKASSTCRAMKMHESRQCCFKLTAHRTTASGK